MSICENGWGCPELTQNSHVIILDKILHCTITASITISAFVVINYHCIFHVHATMLASCLVYEIDNCNRKCLKGLNPRPHMGGVDATPPGRFCALYPLFLKLEI